MDGKFGVASSQGAHFFSLISLIYVCRPCLLPARAGEAVYGSAESAICISK